jgi:BirA family biotin operon repressor/biotin-[acetyl-CoA-carboxylase] ligase
VGNATSLSIETGREVNRDELLATVIENIKSLYGELVLAEGNAQLSGLRDAIIQASATVGQQVSVDFPSREKVVGLAKDIDQTGRLVVETSRETLSVSVGDVLHLRSN